MSSPVERQCSACEVPIQVETAERTGGVCMPCARRVKVRLNPADEERFAQVVHTLAHSGWEAGCSSRRRWLDTLPAVRKAIRARTGVAVALSIAGLKVRDCASGEDACLSLGRLRSHSEGLFCAESVTEHSEDAGTQVAFECSGRSYAFAVRQGDQRGRFLDLANTALTSAGVKQRFLLLGDHKGSWAVGFNEPAAMRHLQEQGLLPQGVGVLAAR